MLANYLKIAFRNLVKSKIYSFINIFGLALGMACVFLILQYLQQELGYDRFHVDAENIYRVNWEDENPQTRTPHPMAQALVHDFPEVESAVSITPLWGFGLMRETFSISNPEKDVRYDESNVMAADTTFFKVFTFPLLKGDPNTALKKPGGLLLSASMAKKYFGDVDPIGKHLAVNSDKQLVEVVGVFQDVPFNSHFHFDFLVSYVTEKFLESPESEFYTWKDFGHYNYIRLKPGINPLQLESKLMPWVRQYINVSGEFYRAAVERNFGFRVQPITQIHLHSHLRWELEPNGYIAYVYMMTAAALLILVIGCANFINITSAQSAERTKEIGIRKSMGAFRRQLVIQFTGESIIVSILAAVLATILIEIALPFFTAITGRPLELHYLTFIGVLAAMGIVTGLVAGIFPSLYLSAGKPGVILKGKFLQGPGGTGFRNSFTVFQFFGSMVLISCSLIIYSQLGFIQRRELGFNKEELVVIPIKNPDAINPRLEELRTELLGIRGVLSVSASSNIPGRSFNQNPVFATQDPQMRTAASEAMIDYDFFSTLGIAFVDGRGFSRQNPADREGFVINETAARNLFSGNAVGKELSWEYDAGLVKGPVIGVVKDFNFQSLHQPVKPLLFYLQPRYNYVLIKLSPSDFPATNAAIERTWKKFDDRFNFEFSFLSDNLNQQYTMEQNMATLLSVFSVIAVVVASFGLLGIATLSFRQKTKEVSIRKVLGASLSGLIVLLLKDFTRMICIALTLAVPLVWWGMTQWLQNFTFRTTIHPVIFIGSGILLLCIAWVTLGYLTLKVANTNPAETLKNE